MPSIDSNILALRVNDPWTQEKLNEYLELREEIKEAFGQDLFYNSFDKEYGTVSLLRRTGHEPTIQPTKGMHGEDAEAPGNNLFFIEIKAYTYSVKNWKLPDITSPSIQFSFDKIRAQETIDKITKYDGYALSCFTTNFKHQPHWVNVHHYEPMVCMYITGSGAVKMTNWLLDLIYEKNEALGADAEIDNTHKNNRIQLPFADVFNLLNNDDFKLIVNGQIMPKSHYIEALRLNDKYWEDQMWKKSLAQVRSA
jgi:hypothetical protein